MKVNLQDYLPLCKMSQDICQGVYKKLKTWQTISQDG